MLGNTNAKIVSGSPIPTQKEYFVKVIDYDGTVIDEQWLDDGEEYTLPSNPDRTNEGLVFQEWSCSQDIVNGKVTINKNDVMIGAVYTTSSGKNEFDIELTNATGLSVTLKINGTKDWGDGTTPDTETTHTYSQAGKYTIKCDGTTLTSSSSSGVFGQSSEYSSKNFYVKNIKLVDGVKIPNYSFQYCVNLETVILSNNNNNNRTVGTYAFQYCDTLKAIVLPKTFAFTSIADGYQFQKCYSLKYIVMSKTFSFGTNGQYTSRANHFAYSCSSLEYIALPIDIVFIVSYAFSYCNLKKLTIPHNVTEITSYAFAGFKGDKIKIINTNCIFDSNTFQSSYFKTFEIPTGITQLSNSLFAQSKLEEINIPNNITIINQEVFYNCSSLKKVTMSDSVTALGSSVFYSCPNLEDITLSDNITSLGSSCFSYNTYVKNKIILPKKLTAIGSSCFASNNYRLEYDFSKCEQVPTLNNVNAFSNINKLAKIKVPSALYNDWITASNWVTLADYIVAV